MALGLEYRFARAINKQLINKQKEPPQEAHATDPRMHLRCSRCAAGDPLSALAENSEESRADQGWRLRRLRYRPAHPERPLAEAVAMAVHVGSRDRRRAGRGWIGIQRGLHEQAAQGGIEGDDPAVDAVRPLLLLHSLPSKRQQMPDAGVLRPLSRLR